MRRQNSAFNLSLLDLLTAALGAVIFLFIITPKGGEGVAVAAAPPVAIAPAVTPNPSSERVPAAPKEASNYREPVVKPKPRTVAAAPTPAPVQRKPTPEPKARPQVASTPEPTVRREPAPAPSKKATSPPDPAYAGTLPSVPARLSFELTWDDKNDNVDLFVCQGNTCVYGNNKREKSIGAWDSGKSRNRLFGNDLRTNQEAVRQFDELLPGTYTLYAMFKESGRGRSSVQVDGLIYTKDDAGKPRGKTYSQTLSIGQQRTRLVTVVVAADGTFTTR